MVFRVLAVLVLASIAVQEAGACRMINWWSSFDRSGYSTCESYMRYLNGLYRNDRHRPDGIYLLEEAQCCPRTVPFYNQPTTCVPGDWVSTFDNSNRWGVCPRGYFLRGLYRSSGNNLHNIEYGHCCKPANHPYYWGSCYDQDVESSFNNKGTSKCNDGYFMVGMYRGSCDDLHCISKFKCCRMYSSAPALRSLSDVKTRVMDTTLRSISYLANYLGYGWCAGCRSQFVGDDFRRNRDSWEAVYTRHSMVSCNGYRANHRLKIHYKDFGFVIKSIQYGKAVIQSLAPTVFDSGTVRNSHSSSAETTLEREVRSIRTVSHTTTSSWRRAHELGIEVSYTPPENTGGFGFRASYTFTYENSHTTTDSTSNQQYNSFKLVSKKTIPGHSNAAWQIMLSKTRSTVPYTAVVQVKFSAELDGFLRYGGGYHGRSTNYHQTHRGSGRRPTLKYTFGDASTPFYDALRTQSSQGRSPWMWSAMMSRWPGAQSTIDELTSDGWYEFTLSGQFEDVVGQHAEIHWRDSSKKRSMLLSRREQKDPPRVFPKPPQVNIPKAVHHEEAHIAVNKTTI